MKIYNTLTRKKEDFQSIEEGKVKMYVCGPTVYDYIHIGNARPLVFFDTVRRYLEYKGYEVDFVMNFTDIDDKIINRAREEGVDFRDISEKFILAFKENAKALNVDDKKIKHTKATDYVGKMIAFIKELEKIGAAYETQDSVYFSVDKAENYGKLSRKNLDDLIAGARVNLEEDKQSPADFALWKKKKTEDEPAWNSPWGEGRPGWHVECSVMAKDTLGVTIDIHGGGEDLQFPHHENEIAQSETLHKHPMANYWMHNGMITVNNEKMSKSLGNFFTLKDIEKEYDLKVIRLWLISSHYRSPLDFSRQSLDANKNAYTRLQNAYEKLENYDLSQEDLELMPENLEKINKQVQQFEAAMDDDFNTSHALAYLFELVKIINQRLDEDISKEEYDAIKTAFFSMTEILGLTFDEIELTLSDDLLALIEKRNQARKNKDWALADQIRDQLLSQGIVLKDTAQGVSWHRVN